MKFKTIMLMSLTAVLLISGCYKQTVEREEELPLIVWPKPPEAPRINFINSISTPEDLNIREGRIKRLFDLLTGLKKRAIVKPYGLEMDSAGRFFVVDVANKLVHVFDSRNGSYYVFPGRETLLESPIDIAVSKNGNIFITDSKRAVVKLFRDFGKEYEGEIGEGILERPAGIAINEISNELLVVDTGSSQIIRYDLDSYKVKSIVGREGEMEGMFHYPTNIFVSKDGRIFVSDSLNFRIQIFTPDWEFQHSFGKAGNSPGFFSRPKGVAVDSEGNIYVVDALFDNVQIFDAVGNLLMDFGGPGYGYGEFWLPSGIFIDSMDRIYVSDTYNKRVQVFQYLKDGKL
jgi:DNA-binding beta-propeller fold protein YncE